MGVVRRSKERRPVHRVGAARFPVFLVAASTQEHSYSNVGGGSGKDAVTEEEQVRLTLSFYVFMFDI